MGLLSDGTPIEFSDEYSGERTHVKMHGVDQFVHLWRRLKGRRKDSLLWGDEVEMVVFGVAGDSKDYRTRTAKLRIDLTPLSRLEHAGLEKTLDMAWKPEYAAFMLEGTPGAPYGPTLADLLSVYPNMRWRRRIANHACALKNASGDVLGGVTEGVPGGALGSRGPKDLLGSGVVTLTSPMQLGTPDSLIRFSGGPVTPGPLTPEPVDPLALSHTLGPVANSVFVPDVVIHPHPRFATLTKNIRARRGSNVDIRLPLFVDSATPVGTACYGSTPSVNASLKDTSAKGTTKGTTPADTPNQSKKEQVHLDAMAFGMGCACLQITFQACSINEARRLYDQLAVVSPLLLSLSAASPVFRGLLTDIDCRWDVISGSVDDRTPSERGLEPLDGSPGKQWRIHKSRYGSISSYLSPGPGPDPCASPAPAPTPGIAPAPAPVNGAFINGRGDVPSHWREEYNDIELEIDVDVYAKLCAEGVDHHLARHVAHLFIRDPLVIYRELLHQEDTTSSDHFENIQSTNWQTMRFKPPPPSSPTTGWRVEFRSLEIQLSDYENAAFAVFVVLLTRTILSLRTNFYMPISLVDSNLASAQKRNAALAETFWWRRDVLGDEAPPQNPQGQYVKLTMNEIINGSPAHNHPGLVPLVKAYLRDTNTDVRILTQLEDYLSVIEGKASGRLMTDATYLRHFITSHPDYRHDSVVSPAIIHDVYIMAHKVGTRDLDLHECIGRDVAIPDDGPDIAKLDAIDWDALDDLFKSDGTGSWTGTALKVTTTTATSSAEPNGCS